MKLHAVGIDLGKTVFHLVGLDSTGRVVIRKRCSRKQLLAFTANLEVRLIGMESGSGAHFLGRVTEPSDETTMPTSLNPSEVVRAQISVLDARHCDSGRWPSRSVRLRCRVLFGRFSVR
jgi:hypothetical protein